MSLCLMGVRLLPEPHPFDPNQPADPPAYDLEAEQAVLGSLMYENEAFLEVDGLLSPQDFHEPFHQRLYKAIAQDIRNGRLADPTMIKTYFAIDPAFHDFGGVRYLGDLVDRAPPWSNVKFYAQKIRSMALRRAVIKIAADLLQRARLDFETEGAELMAGMEKSMLSVSTGKDDLSFQTWGEVSRGVVYGMDRPDEKPLLRFGLDPLDALIGGCEEADMLVLGGRPGMGKSALAACMAMNVALAGYGVASVNAEMNTTQMGRRHLTDLAFFEHGLDAPMYRDIKRGTLTDAQRRIIAETQHKFDQLPMVMVKRTGLTLSRFRAMLMRQKMLWQSSGLKMRLVVLDHAGLIHPDEPTGNPNGRPDHRLGCAQADGRRSGGRHGRPRPAEPLCRKPRGQEAWPCRSAGLGFLGAGRRYRDRGLPRCLLRPPRAAPEEGAGAGRMDASRVKPPYRGHRPEGARGRRRNGETLGIHRPQRYPVSRPRLRPLPVTLNAPAGD